jgi:quercetin dioxygenase-like cupin family protein
MRNELRRALRAFALGCLGLCALSIGAEPPAPAMPVAQPTVGEAQITGANTRLPVEDLMKGRRHFEAGAHTAWHIHPAGQLIVVESGIGFVQRSGEPIRVLHPGDSDFTPPGVAHWHGAAPHSAATMAMVHFGGIGPFLDTISPEQYQSAWRAPNKPLFLPANAKQWPIGSRPDSLNYVGISSSPPADDMQYARGRFEAGSRTAWHIHLGGQVILAEKGRVIVQHRGEPIKVLQPGQSDFTPAGIAHWHGASADAHAQMVVVNFGASTIWLERVADPEYAAANR